MTQNELKAISKTYGSQVAKAAKNLESKLEIFFCEKNNYNKRQWRIFYKLYMTELIKTMPEIHAKVMLMVTTYISLKKSKLKKNSHVNRKKHTR
jgi:hypothetical protein